MMDDEIKHDKVTAVIDVGGGEELVIYSGSVDDELLDLLCGKDWYAT
jgi:hypothetical protein